MENITLASFMGSSSSRLAFCCSPLMSETELRRAEMLRDGPEYLGLAQRSRLLGWTSAPGSHPAAAAATFLTCGGASVRLSSVAFREFKKCRNIQFFREEMSSC